MSIIHVIHHTYGFNFIFRIVFLNVFFSKIFSFFYGFFSDDYWMGTGQSKFCICTFLSFYSRNFIRQNYRKSKEKCYKN